MVAQGHRTVVVADDDPALRMLCRINLELEGYRVLEAESARELDRHLEAEDVDLVLLDVRLGSDDGREVARELRGERPEIAIAFFTGSAPVEEQVGRLADGVLPKPFSLEALSEIVRRLASP
jgi:DNA-binding response OmpR family regulator